MKIGVGIDPTLRLGIEQQRALARESARLGYDSLWTPASAFGRSSFHLCEQWWQATTDVVPDGLSVGISVVPFPAWSMPTLAAQAATAGDFTRGKFTLGVGLGGYASADFRRSLGLANHSGLEYSRDVLFLLRELLAGRKVDYQGKVLGLHGAQIGLQTSPPVPVYLAALGPRMLQLAGELADGVTPNWCTAEQIGWMRTQVGVAKPFALYIRVCVDEDEDAARRAFVGNLLGYAMARPGQRTDQGYRGHFGRGGFEAVLSDLEARRDGGTPVAELVDLVPPELALTVGYFGKPAGAAAALRRLSAGLDEAMVRLITTRPGDLDHQVQAIAACQPAGWR